MRIIRYFLMILIIFSVIAGQCQEITGTDSRFGMQGHLLQGPPDQHLYHMQMMAKAGIRFVRDEIYWHKIEVKKGEIIIPENVKKNVQAALEYGINPLIILDYGNDLYDDGYPPHTEEGRAAFSRYCSAVAEEFKGKIKFYEVWNEPNTAGFWRPAPNAADYAGLCETAYKAVKAVDPDCFVLGGVTAGVDLDFLEEVFAAGGLEYMDAVSVHPYSTPAGPEEFGLIGKLEEARKLIRKHGGHQKLWITEFGWPTHVGPTGNREIVQARMVTRAYVEAFASGVVDKVFWYWFGQDGPDETWWEDRFGLLHMDGSPKPGYTALKVLTEQLAGKNFSGSLDFGEEIIARQFRGSRKDEWVTVLWAPGEFKTVRLDMKNSPVRVIDFMGRQVSGTVDLKRKRRLETRITLTLTGEPYFIVGPRVINAEEPFVKPSVTNITIPVGDSGVLSFKLDISEGPKKKRKKLSTRPLARIDTYFSPQIAGGPAEIVLSEAVPKADWTINMLQPLPDNPELIRLPLEIDGELTGELAVEISQSEPAEITIVPLDWKRQEFKVMVRNMFSTDLDVVLSVKAAPVCPIENRICSVPNNERKLSVPASSVVEETFSIKVAGEGGKEISDEYIGGDTVYEAAAELSLPGGRSYSASKRFSFFVCRKTDKPPVLDGKLDEGEWPRERVLRINRKEQVVEEQVEWTGPEEAGAVYYLAWDDDYFYAAADITDEVYSAGTAGHAIYNNDGFELYFDTDYEKDINYIRYNIDDFQYGMFDSPDGLVVRRWQPGDTISPGASMALQKKEDGNGFYIEGRIPWSEMNFKPEAGRLIGFNISLNDDDDPKSLSPFKQERQMMWSALPLSWQVPRNFSTIFLEED